LPLDKTITISEGEFKKQILGPVNARLAELGDAIDFIVLMRDVPYRVGKAATTTAIMFGGPDHIQAYHGYFGREESFEASIPYFGMWLRPATVISGYTFRDASALIQRSLQHYPELATAGTFYLCDGAGPRGSRNQQIEPRPGRESIARECAEPERPF
jgi:hypothetical protein